MERIEKREGDHWEMCGHTFAVAVARSGRVIIVASSMDGEYTRTPADLVIRRAREIREKVDKDI